MYMTVNIHALILQGDSCGVKGFGVKGRIQVYAVLQDEIMESMKVVQWPQKGWRDMCIHLSKGIFSLWSSLKKLRRLFSSLRPDRRKTGGNRPSSPPRNRDADPSCSSVRLYWCGHDEHLRKNTQQSALEVLAAPSMLPKPVVMNIRAY